MRSITATAPTAAAGLARSICKAQSPIKSRYMTASTIPPIGSKRVLCTKSFPTVLQRARPIRRLPSEKDILRREWGDVPYHTPEQFGGEYLANDFFGGSLAGIIEKLPYLADLGVTVLYLNPIFEAYSNHRYDTGDYETIDSMLGDEKLFSQLCEQARSLGIRIILDGVFNHTGSNSKYFNKNGVYPTVGAHQSKDSPFYDWYDFSAWPDAYACWWGIKTLPHVKAMTPSYLDYILTGGDAIIKKWVRLGASGWRLDVVDELPDEFVRLCAASLSVKRPTRQSSAKYGRTRPTRRATASCVNISGGFELDSVMNYPLRDAMIGYICGRMDAQAFHRTIYSLYENYPREAFYASMNFLSSHDTIRIFTALADVPDGLSRAQQAAYTLSFEQRALAAQRLRLITQLQLSLPGIPSIFYGDEIGTEGFGDPFCRACFDWNKADGDLHAFFKAAIAARKDSDALTRGDFCGRICRGANVWVLRYTETDCQLILINTDAQSDWYAPIELGRFGIERLTQGETELASENGRFTLNIGPMCFMQYPCKRKQRRKADGK